MFSSFVDGPDGRPLAPPTARGYDLAGFSTAAVESIEERHVVSQARNPRSNCDPRRSSFIFPDQGLARGGYYDSLLAPGKALALYKELPSIFRRCLPIDPQYPGMSCNYRETYAREVFSAAAVVELLELAGRLWNPDPAGNIERLNVQSGTRLIICGDTHGQLEDVLWMFFKYGVPSSSNVYLFNGDIVDRGGHALEILLLLFAFKRDVRDSVYILRGNHEDQAAGVHWGFRNEIQSKFLSSCGPVLDVFNKLVFPMLPAVAIVSNSRHRFCVMHGGIPVELPDRPPTAAFDLEELTRKERHFRQLFNPAPGPDELDRLIFFQLLWNDPTESIIEKQRQGADGRGKKFTKDEVERFCSLNRLNFIVRSHQTPANLAGCLSEHDGLTYTVFSASHYFGRMNNKGGVMMVTSSPPNISVHEHWAPPWPFLADVLPQQFSRSPAEIAKVIQDFESPHGITESRVGAPGPGAPGPGAPGPGAPAAAPPFQPPERSHRSQQVQVLRAIMDQIVENKEMLFDTFNGIDAERRSSVPLAAWKHVLLDKLGPNMEGLLTAPVVDRLAAHWQVGDPVHYVRFLHRFQINDIADPSHKADLLKELSCVRRELVNYSAISVERLLDPNSDYVISLQEWTQFCKQFHIDVGEWQAAALYETMTHQTNETTLSLDNAIKCLALVTRDPKPLNTWTAKAEEIGKAILEARLTYASVFREWDKDRTGFLDYEELENGFKLIEKLRHLSSESIMNLIAYIDSMGTRESQDNKVSIFEFVRAVAPRDEAIRIQRSMVREVLKRVWRYKHRLMGRLAEMDEQHRDRVPVLQFLSAVQQMNRDMYDARMQLTHAQLNSICEIACGGTSEVDYKRFLSSLRVEDTALPQEVREAVLGKPAATGGGPLLAHHAGRELPNQTCMQM